MSAEETVREVLREAGIGEVSVSDRIKEDCGFDSLALVWVIVGLEQRLGREFGESDLDPAELETVDDLIALTGKYL